MIVSSYVRHHTLRPEQLSDLITAVHHALSHLGQPTQTEEVLTPAVSVRDPCTTIMSFAWIVAIEEKCSNGTSARDMRSIGSNT
jgi:predicted transcriptional regulator